jgi:ATP-dependent DNA helicase RecQ
VLGILPTGTGKSICYQLPALAKFQRTGALTVVISPLVALMADQVAGLRRHGVSSCVAINGLLSLPERHDALDRVRLGDASILLISPEQLRNPSVRSTLNQREVCYWVIDEAHCLSKWGQDFRPDYRYVSRFIQEYSGDDPPAPLLCLTATARPSVLRDILDHFEGRLGVELKLINGGAFRENSHSKSSRPRLRRRTRRSSHSSATASPAGIPREPSSVAPRARAPKTWRPFCEPKVWPPTTYTPD